MRARKPEITVREITDNYSRSYREMVKIFDVRIADGEINATGILTVPRWPGREKMPAILTFGGASGMGARVFLEEAVARGVKAGDIIRNVSAIAGGSGGGKPDSAMGGGSDLSKLDEALKAVFDFVSEKT